MNIVHFSDFHAGGYAEDWMAYIDKRWVGVFNYSFRRKYQHDLSLLEKAVNYILANRPDVAVCTGDLTSTGQPGEFKKVLKLMEKLYDSDIPVIYVPGNHDYYVHNKRCVQAMKDAFAYLNHHLHINFDDLPVVKEVNGCDFIIVNESWPSNLLSSCGYLKKKSRDFIYDICREDKARARVMIGHYPLIEDHPLLRFRHRMWGQDNVIKLLNEKKIDVSLCGHIHLPYTKLDETGRGEICAGSVTRNACMARIEYCQKEDVFKYEKIGLS